MLTFFYILVFLLLLSSAYANLRGAPWAPTNKKSIERFLRLAKIKSGQKMYDLGCGDGRLVFASARAGAQAKGFELSLFMCLLANIFRLFQKNRKKTKISCQDIWRANLNDADLIYFFLMPKIYPKLKQKFENELKPGTKVVSYVWPITGWEPVKIDVLKGHPNLYLYQR